MLLKHYEKLAEIADRYGWKIVGWAVDLDNPAGITLQSKYGNRKYLRFQHKDSLEHWENVLKANKQVKPKRLKGLPKAKTFDDVVAENKRLKKKLERSEKAETIALEKIADPTAGEKHE